MTRQFHKMHGLGNDFVIMDGREEPVVMTGALAKALADRHTGIGCDQLIVIGPSTTADVRMRIWNHDGTEVESCGNASRCVVSLTGATSIETAGGIVEGKRIGADVEVTLPPPNFEWADIPVAYPMDTRPLPMTWGGLARPWAVSVGNPHVVFFVDDPAAVELDGIGPSIEADPVFPERINVNVASLGPDGIMLRTWERGAGLTRACGTGACATAVVAIASKRTTSPVKVMMPGGTLSIAWQPGETIRMKGGATHVFSGTVDLEAFA